MFDGDPKKDYKSEFRKMYEKSKEWASIRANSPRNLFRFLFNTLENVGTSIEVFGLAFAIPSDGVTLAYAEFGYGVTTVGVFGNAIIDVYDGRFGSASLSIGKHFVSAGLSRVINRASGGVTDKVILDATSKFYENYVIPRIGENILGPVESFQRIEYKLDNNFLLIK